MRICPRKIPLWVTVLIVTSVALTGWFAQQRIAALRSDREEFVARSGAAGLRIDPEHPAAIDRLTKRLRPDRAAAVRQLAADLVADFPKSEVDISSRDEATRRNMAGPNGPGAVARERPIDTPHHRTPCRLESGGRCRPLETDPFRCDPAQRDPDTALAFIRGFGKQPKEVADAFAAWAEPDQRLAFLTVLRQWQAHAVEGEIPPGCFDSCIRQLAIGNYYLPSSFDFSTRWIEDAKLSPTELESITQDLNQKVKPGEEEKCIGWLTGNLPEKIALNRISEIAGSWTMKDPKAADTWIAKASAGPVKNTAARAYAETIFPYDPEEAIRWTMDLPEEEARKWTLEKFNREWPNDDPAGKTAFAKEHGIE